jgi:hypothetical protein
MTSRSRGTSPATTEQPLRAALLEVAQALESGDLDGLVRWCLESCTSLLGATVAAVVDLDRAAQDEKWRVTATDDSVCELIELDLGIPTGACRSCLDRGETTTVADLFSPSEQWAEFAASARKLRLTWTHAQPLRLKGTIIGSLHLFGDSPELPEELDVDLAHAIAELALATGMQQHALDVRSTEVAQLHTALDSRLVIEQAKGILASRYGIDVEQAFRRLRKYARDHRMNIHDVAREVVQNGASDHLH